MLRQLALLLPLGPAGCAALPGLSLDDPRPFAACVAPVVPSTDPYAAYDGLSGTLAGPILDNGTGDPPAECFDTATLQSTADLDRDAAGWVTSADADGAAWTVGFWFPDLPPGQVPGQVVAVEFSYTAGTFGPTIGWVSATDAAGDVVAFVGLGGTLDDLPDPPGLDLERGAVVDRDHDGCGAWELYELIAGGVTVPYGEIAEVGGLEVRHGGLEETVRYGGCADWYVAHAAVAVVPAR